MSDRTAAARTRWIWFGAAAAMLAWSIASVWPFVADDAFISLRYADNLLAGKGLVWNDGERVEGYSNLLWLLLCALLRLCGLDWVAVLRVLGVSCALATLAVLAFGTRPIARPLAAAAALPVAASVGVATWTIGGLETPLALLLVTTGAVLLARTAATGAARPRAFAVVGSVFALLCLVRPDGPLWGGCAALGAAFAEAPSRRQRVLRAAALLAPIAVAVAAQTVFRVVYYGDWVANTARVKVAPSLQSVAFGWGYVWLNLTLLVPLWLPAVFGLFIGVRRSYWRAMCWLAIAALPAWCLYLVVVGGDFFVHMRMFVPALGLLALLSAIGLDRMAASGRSGTIAAAAVAVLAALGMRWLAGAHEGSVAAVRSIFEWQGVAAGEWLREAFGAKAGTVSERTPPLLGVDAAGVVPFYSRLPCVDMLGLCDAHIARAPLPAGTWGPGHTHGDGSYVLDRGVDAVMFGEPPGFPYPMWGGGLQMERDPRFLPGWRLVRFHCGERQLGDGTARAVSLTLWVRLDGRLGVARNGSRLEIPGYLLGCYRQPFPFALRGPPRRPDDPDNLPWLAVVQTGADWWKADTAGGVLRDDGRVVGELVRKGVYVLDGLAVPDGDLRARLVDAPDGVEVGFLRDEDGTGKVLVEVPPGQPLPVRIGAVVLEAP